MEDVVLMGDPRVAAVPVRECGEELVDVRAESDLGFLPLATNPQNSQAYGFLRRSVLERLQRAQDLLPDGYRLLLSEGYRPYDLQEHYFEGYRRRVLDADPALSNDEAFLAASAFVSPPGIAPHVSGAAIDLTLGSDDGAELDLGTPVDSSPLDSDGACYFAATTISAAARRNRSVLADALTAVGLVNYPTEWWHWSFGDRYWALMRGEQHAIFGPMQSPIVEYPTWRLPADR